MRTILAFVFLFCAARATAQPFAFSGVDSTEGVHTFLMSRIDSAKVISSAAKDTVLIQHGSAAAFARIEGKPFYLIARFFTGNIESPFEVFKADTAWGGSGSNPDTLRLVARGLTNSTVWSPHVWDTGTYLRVGSRQYLKELQDSVNYGLLHLSGSNVTTGAVPFVHLLGAMATWVAAPVHSNSIGAPGMQAYDGAGNYYWCYLVNQWARIGPGGYSSSF